MARAVITKHLTRLLTPLVRFFIARGIKFGEVNDALKQAFLNVAKEELLIKKEKVNISKLSVVTGLHRPDVGKLITNETPEESQDYMQKIIWKWQQHKKYLNADQTPKALKIKGADSEFADLVRSVSTALNPYTVLYELERSRLVEKQDDSASLLDTVYVPADNEKKIEYLTADLNDLIQTVNHNIFNESAPPNHHITTEYDDIPEQCMADVRKWIIDQGNAFHEKLRNYLSAIDAEGENTSGPKARVVFGSFSRTEVKFDLSEQQ